MNVPELPVLNFNLSFEEEFSLIYTFPKEIKRLNQEDLTCKLLEITTNIFAAKNLLSALLKSKCTGELCDVVQISLSQRFFLENCAREAKTATIDQLIELTIALKRQEMIYANCLKNIREKTGD